MEVVGEANFRLDAVDTSSSDVVLQLVCNKKGTVLFVHSQLSRDAALDPTEVLLNNKLETMLSQLSDAITAVTFSQ